MKKTSFFLRGNSSKHSTAEKSNWPEVERQPSDDASELSLEDCKLHLFNVDRPIWKNTSKAALIEYYHNISPYLLPYIKDRPQSLHIKLNGALAPGLYIKDMEGREPECATVYRDTRRHPQPGKRNRIDYLVCNNEPTLLWMINLGCIDVNPWNSRILSPEEPDYLVLDLDPSEENRSENGLQKLRETAVAAIDYCQTRQLSTFVKTSGKSGIHVLIPCSGISFPEARSFAERICAEIHQIVPDQSTTAASISQRGNKVYLDASQNDYADTIASPYSVRPYILPCVSTPIKAKELKTIDPHSFTIETIFERLKKQGDLFDKLTDKKIIMKNNEALRQL